MASIAFNRAMDPEIVGETTMDLFNFMQPNLNQPIDVYETIQRPVLEVLGKLAFGYKFGVRIFYTVIFFIIIIDQYNQLDFLF